MELNGILTIVVSFLTFIGVKGYDICSPYIGYTLTCYGDGYCCNGGYNCCHPTYVYELWWFWFIWFIFFVCILSCVICLRRRRMQARYQQIRVAQPVYGTTVVNTSNTYTQAGTYQAPPPQPPTAPPYQYPGQKPPAYHQ